MIYVSFVKAVCDIMVTATSPGAQTERRGGAGPVRGLLGGKDLTGRISRSYANINSLEITFLNRLRSVVSGQKYSMSPKTSSSLVEAWLCLIVVRWTRTVPPAL